jgi:hypothetical protein
MMQDKDYIVLKLITGETVMAVFEGEDERFVKVEYPIQIRTMMIPGLQRESVHAVPYCQFSDSTAFVLEKNHIVYIKRLHQQFIPHYKNFLKSYDEALVPATRQSSQEIREQLEELFGDEEDTLTIEEVNKRLDMLEAIAGTSSKEEELEEDDFLNFIPGNDTKH